MTRGIATTSITLDDRERATERRIELSLPLFFQIRNELNPHEFTRSEVKEEFGSFTTPDPGSSRELSIASRISILVEAGYLRRVRRGVYAVTSTGRNLREHN